MTTFRFSADDLELFRSASHDNNPLHTSHEYARRTAYGGQVVYGILNTILALGRTSAMNRPGMALSRIECEFFDVASLGVEYSIEVNGQENSETILRVSDGRRPILETVLAFRHGTANKLQHVNESYPLRLESKDLRSTEFKVGQRVSGTYAACENSLKALCARAGLNDNSCSSPEISALLWASYLVGMEMPGKRALFSRLVLEFDRSENAATPFDYRAEIEQISPMGELTIRAELASRGQTWARAKINAHVREDITPASTESIAKLVGSSESLTGKVALVTGASRGLGACLVRALALHGCTVVMNFLHSRAEAEAVRDSIDKTPGHVRFEQGDIGDEFWSADLAQRLKANFKRLDFLICNASPPLLPLWLEPCTAARVNEFLTLSLHMITTPTANLMPMLAGAKGWHVLISSTAATQIHPYFPHYSAAKSAAEAITRAAVAEYRMVSGLIARPARLLTDLTNTPLGRKGALAPETVAATIVRRLLGSPIPGKVEVLDDFSHLNAR